MSSCALCHKLELKIIPVGVFAICAAGMFLCDWLLPALAFHGGWRFMAGGLLVIAGVALIPISIHTFQKAQTPKTPNKPEVANQLVTWGIYAFTRNPMYLGGTLIAIGLAFFIGNYSAFVFAFLFMAYIDRFQIQPEERILKRKFPDAFAQYAHQTRRWF